MIESSLSPGTGVDGQPLPHTHRFNLFPSRTEQNREQLLYYKRNQATIEPQFRRVQTPPSFSCSVLGGRVGPLRCGAGAKQGAGVAVEVQVVLACGGLKVLSLYTQQRSEPEVSTLSG